MCGFFYTILHVKKKLKKKKTWKKKKKKNTEPSNGSGSIANRPTPSDVKLAVVGRSWAPWWWWFIVTGGGGAVAWACQWQTIGERSKSSELHLSHRAPTAASSLAPIATQAPTTIQALDPDSSSPVSVEMRRRKIDNSIKIELFYYLYIFKLIMFLNILIYFRLI